MYGELPTGPVIFAACDSKYFIEHGEQFIYSATRFRDCHIHIVNPTDEAITLCGLLSATAQRKVTYTFTDIKFNGDNKEAERTYYACLRFFVLPHILHNAQKVLTLDIDCLVLKDFPWPDKPIAYYKREPLPGSEWETKGTRVAAGAIYFSIEKLKVAESISKLLYKFLSTGQMKWFADQVALHEILDPIHQSEKSYFDSNFMDWEFTESSVIWTGKGPRKHNNERYLTKKFEFSFLESIMSNITRVVLQPRLDIPFKKDGLCRAGQMLWPEIRQHWKNFAELYTTSDKSLLVEMPNWHFNKTIENYITKDTVVYVPHKEQHNFGDNPKFVYYMQMVIPWLFTIDQRGWCGGAEYADWYTDEYKRKDDVIFDFYSLYVKMGGTKFWQPSGEYKGKDPFILVPVQLPHDETIKHHSDITVEEFVTGLCKWSEKTKIKIVFKGHPVNLQSMAPIKSIVTKYKTCEYVDSYSIQDLLEKCKCVYTINSGTGWEAMLYEKPVVTFGRSEYSCVTIPGDLNDLDKCWNMIDTIDVERYKNWLDWFVGDICVDTRKRW